MPRLVVNDRPLEFRLDPQTPLLWALRDAANLTGTKYGCGSGECGACAVLVDGEARASCQISLAEAEGRTIVTIEGIADHGFAAVQRALVDAQAIQCGFCTPGIIVHAAALLARNAGPTPDDVRAAIPNLCRCGVQPRLVSAIVAAGAGLRQHAAPPVSEPGVPGTAVPGPAGPVPASKAAAGPAPLPSEGQP